MYYLLITFDDDNQTQGLASVWKLSGARNEQEMITFWDWSIDTESSMFSVSLRECFP